MASLSKYRTGFAIQWVEGVKGRNRKTIYLPKMSRSQAQSVRVHVAALITAKKAQTTIPDKTAAWVASVDPAMREKLYGAGLIEKPKELDVQSVETLAGHINRFIEVTSAKESTKHVWKRCRRLLVAYFGADRPLDSVTVGDAKGFRAWCLSNGRKRGDRYTEGLSENTTRKMCAVASQFFSDAVERELISSNPFAVKGVPRTVGETTDRKFITRETIQKVIDACPDAEWRLIFALSRYGGLRCPSEHLALRWADVDWDQGRMRVRSPKTEHHTGKESRMVPIFPELRPYLEDAWDPGNVYVIQRSRDAGVNLRTQAERIISSAGVEQWPRLFHALRASRQTELTDEFPVHVVCAWIGNSIRIAAHHYLMVQDEHFRRASAPKNSTAKSTAVSGVNGTQGE